MQWLTSTMIAGGSLIAAEALCGCTHHIDVQPIRIEPIYVNVNVRVDRELDRFFDFENEPAATPAPAAPPAEPPPAAAPPPASTPPAPSNGGAPL